MTANLENDSKIKISEMRTAKLSSVKRVMYCTNALRSNATIISKIKVTHAPIQNRNDMKSKLLSLKYINTRHTLIYMSIFDKTCSMFSKMTHQ